MREIFKEVQERLKWYGRVTRRKEEYVSIRMTVTDVERKTEAEMAA